MMKISTPRYVFRLVALFGLLLLISCARMNENVDLAEIYTSAAGEAGGCSISEDRKTLSIFGKVDDAMLSCVETYGAEPIKTIRLNSQGGNVLEAHKIAAILETFQADMIVDKSCNSSCANYFLPLAKSIRLKEYGLVMLHGSIDDSHLTRVLKKYSEEDIRQSILDDYEQEQKFREQHNINKGWLLYRTAEEFAAGSYGSYISGKPKIWFSFGNNKPSAILVEEAFMRSCLPHVEIYPFEDTAVQKMYDNKKMRKTITRQGIYPSGSMRCKSPN